MPHNFFIIIVCCVSSSTVASLDLEEMENISPFRKRCIIPMLGLIENSLYENSLLHNILCMLLQLLNACPKLTDILLDHGLLYVLFNTLSTLNGMENGYGGPEGGGGFKLCIESHRVTTRDVFSILKGGNGLHKRCRPLL